MKKLFLLNSDKKEDLNIISEFEELGYSISPVSISDLTESSRHSIRKTDIVFWLYDDKKFNHILNDLLSLLNGANLIFLVDECGPAMFRNMRMICDSWYLKRPFGKDELDFLIQMSPYTIFPRLSDKVTPEKNISFTSEADSNELITFDGSGNEKNDTLRTHELLDTVYEHAPSLILLIDKDLRVERVNNAVIEAIGKYKNVIGVAGGYLFSCINSFKGEGCCTNPECLECSIRNAVIETLRSGKDCHKIEGSLEVVNNGEVLIRDFLISTAYVSFNNEKKVILYLDDITDRKKAEKVLQESEDRFQVLYENIPGGTIIIGEDYIIEDVNQRTCEVTGYKKEELVGQLCDIVCPKGSLSKKCPIWVDGLNGFQGMDTAIKCKDGSKTPILKNSKRIFIEGDQYILENFQDISDRKNAEEAIIDAKLAAEEASRTKSEFLATMSHELRTPLNAIIGYSDLLIDGTFGELNPKQTKSLNHISGSGKHLLEMINDILDISKVESGKMELHYEKFLVDEIFGNVMNIVSPLARKKDIELQMLIGSEKLSLNADKIRFKQILFNLASNAVKFTPEGGHVLLRAEQDGNMAEFSVIDTGIGISSADLGKLFLPFHQIDSTMSRKYDGTGLGLSLVKKLVEMHGGDVSVNSEPGKGSNFSFRIPLDVATY